MEPGHQLHPSGRATKKKKGFGIQKYVGDAFDFCADEYETPAIDELYDRSQDPLGQNYLADAPKHSMVLEKLRKAVGRIQD